MTEFTRGSGILMPVTSLPSPYGVGTLGAEAFKFIDFLYDAKQSFWQILPLGPTGYGDSPYASFSSFAGNPYLIDLDILIKDGILSKKDVSGSWGDDKTKVDYGLLYVRKFHVLRKVFEIGKEKDKEELQEFIKDNEAWLLDYALFMAVKNHFGGDAWTKWPKEDIRLHREDACRKYHELLADEVLFYEYVQYLFFKQWKDVKDYANSKGIKIIGDIPIYVALDSADVWAEPNWFQLDTDNRPVWVSGVPPDAFSEEGQLWGNPLYDWDKMRDDGYGWWIRRIGGASKLYDVVRIDHYRGFESYWRVGADEKTAINGEWIKGPGLDIIGRITSWFTDMTFIAEDLGILTDEVKEFVKESHLPGMKVLEFAFDASGDSDYLTHKYDKNCICYTGTHDNETLSQWLKNQDKKNLAFAEKYLGLNKNEGFLWGIIRGGMCSAAQLFVAQMQDYLELGEEARMNTPGTAAGNWVWRMEKGALTKKLSKKIAEITVRYGRGLEWTTDQEAEKKM